MHSGLWVLVARNIFDLLSERRRLQRYDDDMTKTTTMPRFTLTHTHHVTMVYLPLAIVCTVLLAATTYTCQKRGPFEIQICEPQRNNSTETSSSWTVIIWLPVYKLRWMFSSMLVTRGVRRGGKVLIYTYSVDAQTFRHIKNTVQKHILLKIIAVVLCFVDTLLTQRNRNRKIATFLRWARWRSLYLIFSEWNFCFTINSFRRAEHIV